MRYFVKPLFSGWHEVSEEQYNRFIARIREGATAMNEQQKQQLIERVTRVEQNGGYTAHDKEETP